MTDFGQGGRLMSRYARRSDFSHGEHENGKWDMEMNFDVSSYHFEDLDLRLAVSRLPIRDQNILILRLMGHNQRDIAQVSGVTRSMISKRLRWIRNELKRRLK